MGSKHKPRSNTKAIRMYEDFRFWSKVDKRGPDECWLWTASYNPETGYGAFWFEGKTITAPRMSFFLKHKKWPKPSCCHHCDNRACCNPAHLFEGTQGDNIRDMFAKGRNNPVSFKNLSRSKKK